MEASIHGANSDTKRALPDIWNWLCALPKLSDWESSVISMELCNSYRSTKCLLLVAEKTMEPENSAGYVTFSFVLGGDWPLNCAKALWVSNPFSFGTEESMENNCLPLLLQVIREVVERAPKLGRKPAFSSHHESNFFDPISIESSESFKEVCNLAFLSRLFWLCAFEAPVEVGSLYLDMVEWRMEEIASNKALASFLVSIGADLEEQFMRSLGYIFTKWMCLRSFSKTFGTWEESFSAFISSYATKASNFWKVRAFAPVLAMKNVQNSHKFRLPDTDDSLLQYMLSHQQLEVTVQLHHRVTFHEDCIEVEVRIDNLRCDVSQLAFNKTSGVSEERHFPSRISVTIAPEKGSDVLLMRLSKSSENPSRDVYTHKNLKGSIEGSRVLPTLKASAIAGSTVNLSSWKFEQSGEGNKGTLEWTLYDNMNGKEVATHKPSVGALMDPKGWFRDRYCKANRPFTAKGGVVFASDEYGQSMRWLFKRNLEGKNVKWNVRACIWVSYWPNVYKTLYCESRYLEVCNQVELPLSLDHVV